MQEDKLSALVKLLKPEVAAVKPSSILKFNQDISKIPGILKLTLGEPDFTTPEHIKAAGVSAIEQNDSHYTNSAGKIEVRQATANYLATKYNVHYDPASEILVTAGTTEAIFSALTTIVSKGDEVLIPTPIFPLYIPDTTVNQGVPVFMDTSANHFVLSPELLATTLKDHPRAKVLVLNYPTNPTGVTYRRKDLEALAKVLRQYNVFVLCDEIYSELTYGEPHVSMAELLPEQTILLNGVSKSHAMTGWRIGVLAAPAAIAQEIGKVHQFAITSATTVAQDAALEAFKNGLNDGQEMKQAYEKRRDYLFTALQAIGFECVKPEGAFYLFVKIPASLPQDSFKCCYELAQEAKVALIPGASFGGGGEGYVRISYAASLTDLKEAVKRLKNYLVQKS
ncbi:aminotransferase class I/II-fold pyridoxal phosphate-dependent enzyme [Loigolactobacillus backii]|uniref:Aminotransferase n=1 Tax=Loigolactobacillus backii TaxID=375175 RepID=A0A192GZ83_9LACO|nr:aminotransferase class I/II-fold pyridoxal phosphate-dependent enzyme [Loigolactobacillus backii]ANK58988.1 aromatic amino acid aminotransferase [Loigolactobacillus backii]ANK61343.1 aromatic amino acid aminotransferase [Loigolactobacillus backii]ANK63976.1 aromatic amino acid aminotransferase [Loigolactobacillus backii]ANK66425.1 aromatic amino acid aminotransferase [Loigolactobacillus backii]ANK69457.1 aromatic amino acid aminotransferase [Loigolactobacillus backii]